MVPKHLADKYVKGVLIFKEASMRSHWGIFLILFYFQFIFTPLAARAEYKYFQSESRFPYEVKLLRTALRKAGDNTALKEHPLENYARGMRLLEEGVVDVGFFAATPELEKRFAPIKQDILNGLLGYSFFLSLSCLFFC